MTLIQMRDMFPGLYREVQNLHATSELANGSHDFCHDVMVAQTALMIAPDAATGRKAWCAALLHSIDHLVVPEECKAVTQRIGKQLEHAWKRSEIEEIVQAALRHAELNRNDQSPTQQVLMDADRLVNLDLSVVIRAAQFRPGIPPFELEYVAGSQNPESTYLYPKSVLDALRLNVSEYCRQLRLPKAIEIGKERRIDIEWYIEKIERSMALIELTGIEL